MGASSSAEETKSAKMLWRCSSQVLNLSMACNVHSFRYCLCKDCLQAKVCLQVYICIYIGHGKIDGSCTFEAHVLTQRKPYLRTPEIHVLGKKHSAAFQPESYCLRAPTNTKPENSWTIFGHLSSGTWTTGGPEPSLFPSWALLKPHQQCWHSSRCLLQKNV